MIRNGVYIWKGGSDFMKDKIKTQHWDGSKILEGNVWMR